MFLKSLALIICISFFVAGCASVPEKEEPKRDLAVELRDAENKLAQLEAALAAKDEEVNYLRNENNYLKQSSRYVVKEAPVPSRVTRSKRTVSVKSEYDPKEVQRALKKAGYYTGKVDGIVGTGTKRAIKDFQKDHGLTSDGVVGAKTWAKLKEYLGIK